MQSFEVHCLAQLWAICGEQSSQKCEKKSLQSEETSAEECGTCSVSHWFLCRTTVISVCCAWRKEKDVYPIFNRQNVEHRSDSEFFSAFLRLMKCLSSQENAVIVIYYVCTGYHSELGWFRVKKSVPAYNFMDNRQRKSNKICTMTQSCTSCQVLMLLSSVPLCPLPFSGLHFNELVGVSQRSFFPPYQGGSVQFTKNIRWPISSHTQTT